MDDFPGMSWSIVHVVYNFQERYRNIPHHSDYLVVVQEFNINTLSHHNFFPARICQDKN